MQLLNSILDNLKTNFDYRFGKLKYNCVDINLTGKCTFDCIFCECQQLDGATDLSTAELYDLADQMVGENINDVFMGGGEPLMRKDFLDLVQYYAKKGIHIDTITNGSLPHKLSTEALTVIDECVDSIAISIDSAVPEQHNMMRNNSSAFKLAMDSLEKLSSLKKTEKSFTVVITRQNYSGFPGLVDLAKRYSFDRIDFQPVSDAPNYPELNVKPGKSDLMLQPEDFDALKSVFAKVAVDAKKSGIKTNIDRITPWIYQYFENHRNNEVFYHGMINKFRCIVAFNRINIRHNGNVQLCSLLPGFGNIRESKLKDLLRLQVPDKKQLKNGKIKPECLKCFCGMDSNLRFSMTNCPIDNWQYLLPVFKQKIFSS